MEILQVTKEGTSTGTAAVPKSASHSGAAASATSSGGWDYMHLIINVEIPKIRVFCWTTLQPPPTKASPNPELKILLDHGYMISQIIPSLQTESCHWELGDLGFELTRILLPFITPTFPNQTGTSHGGICVRDLYVETTAVRLQRSSSYPYCLVIKVQLENDIYSSNRTNFFLICCMLVRRWRVYHSKLAAGFLSIVRIHGQIYHFTVFRKGIDWADAKKSRVIGRQWGGSTRFGDNGLRG